jgi:hypothetical protein
MGQKYREAVNRPLKNTLIKEPFLAKSRVYRIF